MEIHQVLSPASGRQVDSQSVSSQRTPPPKIQPQQTTLSLEDLSSLIKDSVVTGVQEGLTLGPLNNLVDILEKVTKKQPESIINKPVSPEKRSNKRLSSQDNDNDLPRVGLDAVHEDTAPPVEVFGHLVPILIN